MPASNLALDSYSLQIQCQAKTLEEDKAELVGSQAEEEEEEEVR